MDGPDGEEETRVDGRFWAFSGSHVPVLITVI